MKLYNQVRKYGRKVAAGAAMLPVMVGSAWAAVDPAVTAAIDEGTADGKAIGGALLVLAIAVGVVLYIKRKAG